MNLHHLSPAARLRLAVRRWWRRPAGARAVLAIALPLLVSTASWTVMNFMDRMFLLWYDETAFAASLPAAMLQWTAFCLPMGIAGYVGTFVAQYHGAKRPERIGAAMAAAVRFCLVATPVLLLGIPLAPHLFSMVGHSPALAHQETIYFQTLSFGAGGAVFAAALSAFFTGLGRTRVVMAVMVSTTTANVGLDWLFIFGNWGFPEMGIVGAGLATVIAQWMRVACYWFLMNRPAERNRFRISMIKSYDPALMRRLFRFGAPNGLHLLVEGGGFTLFILLLGKLGTRATSASTLAFNVNSVAFVPMLGLGMALSVIVGQQLGADRPRLAARATWTAATMALVYSGIFAVCYVAVPDVFLVGHAEGIGAVEFAQLRETTVVLLRFVAAYCLFDAVNVIFASAIKGAGDTRFILLVNLIVSPVPVITTFLGLEHFVATGQIQTGLWFCWWVVTAWITALGLIYFGRFLQGKWQEMRVIEADTDEGDLIDASSAEPAGTVVAAEA